MKGNNIIKVENNILESIYPWFIKFYKGRPIVTINDFYILVGEEIGLGELIRDKSIINYIDWNGIGKGKNREEFERVNEVKYEDDTLIYLHITGFLKILKIFINENRITLSEVEKIINLLDNRSEARYIS